MAVEDAEEPWMRYRLLARPWPAGRDPGRCRAWRL